ncbi:unnamed protein product [Trichobilharzia regenti]|nr:unnamed protein product [Trichobilharzia regenti]
MMITAPSDENDNNSLNSIPATCKLLNYSVLIFILFCFYSGLRVIIRK